MPSHPDAIRLFVGELAAAAQHTMTDEEISVYTRVLQDEDEPTLAEACLRLMKSAKFFPRVSEIRETCRLIRAEEERQDASEIYSRKEWLPQSRADMWLKHLRDTLTALRLGLPRPPTPEPLDTADVTYRCHRCQDHKFVPVCDCGKSSCRNCKYHYVTRCHCVQTMPA